MKALFCMFALCGLVFPLAACETYSDTPSENLVRVQHAVIMNSKGISDDMERIMYIERPVWLSRYPIPND